MEHGFKKLQGSEEEQMELKLWDKWKDEESPDTFKFLELAKDGGFSEVKDLYAHSRWVSASMLILFVLYNVYSVYVLDMQLCTDPDAAQKALGIKHVEEFETITEKFYISKSLTAALFGDKYDSTNVLGFLELGGMAFYFLNILLCIVRMLIDDGFKRWFHTQLIFWDILPTLSSYSAMKLLNAIVPTVFISEITTKIGFLQEAIAEGKGKASPVCGLIGMLVWTVVAFVIGFDTFLMKLRVVSHVAGLDVSEKSWYFLITKLFLPLLQFLIQVLGVVQLGPFVRKRLFVFIFGGEDGILQDEEIELMETWNALLARRMYRDLTFSQFIAVMCSFSDEDFQSLVLNENAEVKEAEIGH